MRLEVDICIISEKKKVRNLDTFGKLLIQIKNNNGPKNDPCGIPQEIFK